MSAHYRANIRINRSDPDRQIVMVGQQILCTSVGPKEETLLACDWLFVSSFLYDGVFTSDPSLIFNAGNQMCGSLYDILLM